MYVCTGALFRGASDLPSFGVKAAKKFLGRKVSPPPKKEIPNVKRVIAVASGKGGVGKSTTAVNLALALSRLKRKVGILDADIFGPSIPMLMNLKDSPELLYEGQMKPLKNYGVECMSMGFLVDPKDAIAWRGMMVMKALQQLLYQVSWSELDLLVIDMPPGTGDTQLTIGQLVPLAGAIIVSTPQDVALIDARKGVDFFKKVNVPILGLVQNMSHYCCPKCSDVSYPFGHEGASKLASEMDLSYLGDLPLNPLLCKLSDEGTPIVVSHPESRESQLYLEIARKVDNLVMTDSYSN
ncbi:hypothetical protein DSO57_1008298 [Entomophthora muscae]|uniref:Uncharacterized protein n=1 Tax=Entomophthora muscae TaxID=34485 RepID=A0ACC2UU65_9FUNG|nr:hypothetical protein DSO57_1008298 [Entomophthora muscae]